MSVTPFSGRFVMSEHKVPSTELSTPTLRKSWASMDVPGAFLSGWCSLANLKKACLMAWELAC